MLHVLVLPVQRESTERQGEDFSFVARDLQPADATNTTTAKVNLARISSNQLASQRAAWTTWKMKGHYFSK